MKYDGIYDDGWVTEKAHVMLQRGGAANLVLRAFVPCENQHLEIRVDGQVVASQPVAAGALDLRLPVSASPSERRVDLLWAETTPLNADDPREAAALLQFLNVTTQKAPAALRIPGGLLHPGAQHTGIYADGWVEEEARVLLAPGPDATLVVRGSVPHNVRNQHLVVAVDGEAVIDSEAGPGSFDFRTPLRSSDAERVVELRWAAAEAVSASDARLAAALLMFVGVTSGSAPHAIARFPADLADPNVVQSGIHPDGWVDRQVTVDLAGGKAAELVIRAEISSSLSSQRLDVRVDGAEVATGEAADETLDLRIALPATEDDRRVELLWAKTCQVSDLDSRQTAARLRFLGMASGIAPNALARFPADLLDPNLVHSGIYADGWLARESQAVLAGGPAARLVIRARVPEHIHEQALDVLVNGARMASETAVGSLVDLRIDVPPSDAARTIELRWERTAPVAEDDPRPAAALLDLLALTPQPG